MEKNGRRVEVRVKATRSKRALDAEGKPYFKYLEYLNYLECFKYVKYFKYLEYFKF